MAMRLFVCEYVTGGGLAGAALPTGLCREGDMMLAALVKNLVEVPGVELVLSRDSRLPPLGLPVDVRPIGEADDPWRRWRRLAEEAGAVWPIAPETGGALERLSRLVLAAGRRLIGSRPEAVGLAASKQATVERLRDRGLPVVPSRRARALSCDDLPDAPEGWVAKPDDGAGCEETRLFRRREDLARWLDGMADAGRFVIQPYLPGAAASLSMLCRNGRAWLLSCNRQHVVLEDGRLAYRGGVAGGLEHRRPVYEPLAEAIAAAMPGLWGHVGVDLVDGSAGPVVLEVNPRLTTSFTGLRQAIGMNPAVLALALLDRDLAALRRPLRGEASSFAVEGADG